MSDPQASVKEMEEEAPVTDHSQELVPMIIGVKRSSKDLLDLVKRSLVDAMGTTDDDVILNKVFEIGLAVLGSAFDRSTTAYLPASMAPHLGIILGDNLSESSVMLVDFLLASEDRQNDTLVGAVGMAQTTDRYPVAALKMKQSGTRTECVVQGHRTVNAEGKAVFGGWTIEPSDKAGLTESESPLPGAYSNL